MIPKSATTNIRQLETVKTPDEAENLLRSMPPTEVLEATKIFIDRKRLTPATAFIYSILENTKAAPAPNSDTGNILFQALALTIDIAKKRKASTVIDNAITRSSLVIQENNLNKLLTRYLFWLPQMVEDTHYELLEHLDDNEAQQGLLSTARTIAENIEYITTELSDILNPQLFTQLYSQLKQYQLLFSKLPGYPAQIAALRSTIAQQAQEQSRMLEHAESIYYSAPKNPPPNTPSDLTVQAEKIFRSIIDTISMVNFAQYLELRAAAVNTGNQKIDSPETAKLRDISLKFNAMASSIVTIPGNIHLQLLITKKRYSEAEQLIADSLKNARSHMQTFLDLQDDPETLIIELNDKISTLKIAFNKAKILLTPDTNKVKRRIAEQIKLATEYRDLTCELSVQPDKVTAYLNDRILHLKCLNAQVTANAIPELEDAEQHYQNKKHEECRKSLKQFDENLAGHIKEVSECKEEETCEPEKEEKKLKPSLVKQMFANAKSRSLELKATLAIDDKITTNSPSSATPSTEDQSQSGPNLLQLKLQLRNTAKYLEYLRVDLRPEAYQASGKRQQEKARGATLNNPLLTARCLEAAEPQLTMIKKLYTQATSQLLAHAKQAFDSQQFSRCQAFCNKAIGLISTDARETQQTARPFPVVSIYHNAAEPFERLSKAAIIEMRKIKAQQNSAEERAKPVVISFKPGLFSGPTSTAQAQKTTGNKRNRESLNEKENIGNSPDRSRPHRRARIEQASQVRSIMLR